MTKFLKSFLCIVTSIVIFAFSVVPVQSVASSTAITPEKEMCIYASVTEGCEYGIPYMPSYFQSLTGWKNCESNWNKFLENSIYDNRAYTTTITSDKITLKIVNYDSISVTNQAYFKVSTCTYISLVATYSSDIGLYSVTCSISSAVVTNSTVYLTDYIAFSTLGDSVLVDDGDVYYELFDEDKNIGISDCIKKLLTGQGVDILSPALFDVCNSLGILFSNDLSASLSNSLDIGVEVGDDTYNEVINDLTNNTTTSNIWQQLDSSTSNNIKNSYSNFKQCLDNSLSVYNDDDNNYHYSTSNSADNRNLSNYQGDTNTYYQTYIYSSSDDDNIGGSGIGNGSGNSNSNSGGAYAEANANAEINQGDIIVNVPSVSGTSSGSSSDYDIEDIDISSFTTLLDKCVNYLSVLKSSYYSLFPDEVRYIIEFGVLSIVILRVLGR